jgi:hypothetical protein
VVRRTAFTLIELIFAIVLIGITVLTLPKMVAVVNEGIDSNILQEAIFAAATELNQVTTSAWDENSMEAGATLEKVIDLGGMCDNNVSNETFRQRLGHISEEKHRRCLDSNATVVALSNTNAAVDALEDMVKTNQDLFVNPNPTQAGYKNLYKVTVAVAHNPSFHNGNNANLKKVTVTILDNSGNTVTSLMTYSANIGEVDFYKRSY